MKQIRGIGTIQGFPTPNFDELEDRGLTDVFFSTKTQDYLTLKDRVETCLKTLESTNLNLHIIIVDFTTVDPENASFQTTLLNNIELITAETEIAGISTDDYRYWPPFEDAQNDEHESDVLVSLAESMTTACHEGDSTSLMSVAVYPYNAFGMELSALAPHVDFIMPELYRFDGGYMNQVCSDCIINKDKGHAYVKQYLKQVISQSGNTPVVPYLISFDSDTTHNIYSYVDISEDMRMITDYSRAGYALWASPWLPENIHFPSSVPVPRRTVNRKFINRFTSL